MKTSFKSFSESTREDWEKIVPEQLAFSSQLPSRILAHLQLLADDYGGFPVTRLTHSLQTAQLAADGGEDDEYVVCALLHDIGDSLGSYNHADLAAAILKPFVSPENHWMVEHHAIFQGYNFFHHLDMDRNMRERFRGSEHFERTEAFIAKYDNLAFDADRTTPELELFRPLVERVLESPKNSLYQAVLGK